MKLYSRDDTTPRARATWARAIDRLLTELGRAPSPLRNVRRLYRHDVALASAPALSEIEEVLRDPTAAVRPEAMRRLRAFLTDGGRSRLYRDDPEAARRAAREIAVAFVVPAHAGMRQW